MECYGGQATPAEHLRCDCQGLHLQGELKRLTDREQHSPFSPYNLRLFRQTFHGIRDVLGPLVAGGYARVLPMQEPLPDRAWLLEICPASTIRSLGIKPTGYKGATRCHLNTRGRIVGRLEQEGVVLPDAVKGNALDDQNGDVLDSIVAAFAVFRSLPNLAISNESRAEDSQADYQIEGHIYV